MTRMISFIAALLLASLAVSSACLAGPSGREPFRADAIRFEARPSIRPGKIELSLHGTNRGNHNFTSQFAPADLTGLDLAALRSGGEVRFALIREAGRVDCAGRGAGGSAAGACRFTPDAGFAAMLAAHGISRPDSEQAYALTVVGATRALLEALHAARYATPTLDELTALAALGVSPRSIGDLSRHDSRDGRIGDLIQFAALDISPAYIGDLARVGYAGLSADELVQLKALEITPAFVQGFAAVGYPHLPVGTLVQLKALDVTPADVASLRDRGLVGLTPEKAVALRALTRAARK